VTRPRKPPRYTVIPHPDATADVTALATYGLEVVAAAVAIADDLAHGRVIGKELGDRHVSGNLTGFARVKFDVSGQRPQRFGLIYRQLDDITLEIVAIGPRDARHLPRRGATPHAITPLDTNRAVLVGAVVALPGILLRLSVRLLRWLRWRSCSRAGRAPTRVGSWPMVNILICRDGCRSCPVRDLATERTAATFALGGGGREFRLPEPQLGPQDSEGLTAWRHWR
jgi:hypothetical protein